MNSASKILVEFDEPVEGDDGRPYRARVVGAETPLGHWEGWLEFTASGDETATFSSGRETTQPNYTDLGYWATGLTRVYLQGALRRALSHVSSGQTLSQSTRPTSAPTQTAAKSPRRARSSAPARTKLPRAHGTPVLDPFAVYAQSEGILRQELRALSADHLRTIIDAYALEDASVEGAEGSTREELAERIVNAVKRLVATA